MDDEVKIKFKFKCVLFELLKSDYKVTDDTILEKLITHLSSKEKGCQIIDVPLCLAWIRSVVLSWHQGKTSAAITSFAIRLLSIIVESETHFANIQTAIASTDDSLFDCNSSGCVFMEQLKEMYHSTSKSSTSFSLKCALIQLLCSLLKHSCGRQWIMGTGLWQAVHEMSLNDSSIYVVREGRRFLSKLLNEMSSSQEAEAVLGCILEPFISIPSYEDTLEDNMRVTTSLYLMYEVLQNIFKSFDPETSKFYSPLIKTIYQTRFGLLPKCLDALKLTKSEEWEELLSKIAIFMYILDLIKDGQKREGKDVKATCVLILNVFNMLISKGSVDNVLKLCVICHNHWWYVGKVQRRNEEETANGKEEVQRYRFEDQLLCLQLAPIFSCIVATPIENDKELYLYKLFHKTCFESQRLVFTFRNLVFKQQQVHLYSAMSARSIMFLADTLSRTLPLYVGLSLQRDEFEEIAEAHILKLTSILHNHVLRLVYALRDAIVKHGFRERVALLSVSSILSLKDVLNRITPLYVGCTIGDSALEADFQIKVARQLEVDSIRIIYNLRDALSKNNHLMDRSALLAVCSMNSLKGSAKLERERAVLVFQSFIYVLKHFVLCAESETKQGGWGGEFRQSHHSTLLVAILDGLANLVRSHKITWRESVESLCLLTLAQQLLDSPTFSSKVGLVVQALHLIQLCIENFMPPNLALLTNSLSGTSFDQLGPLIFLRLHDPHWEVRDSSLEVLLTLATISHTKYPLFQDLILENKLCETVVHLALNDAESYVCASATKCLTAMVQVDRLWNEELCDKDLVNKMIGVLNGESEGVLRREASLLMTQIFKHRKVPADVLHKMCVTMSNVVLSDLHWEVKVNALSFWELIIEHQMNNQGMIDGVFPQVTFSKEHRKIINLTPAAIQERLKKVLGELSQNGCLFVLLEAVRKDEDLEVVKRTSQIIMSLSVVLERHGLLRAKSLPASTPSPSEPSPSSNSDHELSPSAEQRQIDVSLHSSLCMDEMSSSCVDYVNPQDYNSFNHDGNLESSLKTSILDLDPQAMGFAVLDDAELPSVPSNKLQDSVIESILNDKDINLIANVYLGTGAEVPGRQGPETKVSKPMRPLIILNSDEFLNQLSTLRVDEIVNERTRWIKDTGCNLHTLLDDMLIMRNIQCDVDEECNIMDCY